MNERDFFYWLQGFFEISETKVLSEKQIQVIKDHMALVATKVTPDRSEQTPTKHSEQDVQKTLEEFLNDTRPHNPQVICSGLNTKLC